MKAGGLLPGKGSAAADDEMHYNNELASLKQREVGYRASHAATTHLSGGGREQHRSYTLGSVLAHKKLCMIQHHIY